MINKPRKGINLIKSAEQILTFVANEKVRHRVFKLSTQKMNESLSTTRTTKNSPH